MGLRAERFRSFRAWKDSGPSNPGRCPGLSPCAPLGQQTIRSRTMEYPAPFCCRKEPLGTPDQPSNAPAPKGQNEIAQGKAKRRPGYGSVRVDAPRGYALSGLGRTRAHRTQGVALGYHLAPRWGKRPLDRVRWIILPRPVVAKDPWRRLINHRTLSAPTGQNEIAQGRAKRRPGYGSVWVDAPR